MESIPCPGLGFQDGFLGEVALRWRDTEYVAGKEAGLEKDECSGRETPGVCKGTELARVLSIEGR